MSNNIEFLRLKSKYDELDKQFTAILKEQRILLEELQKVCPHKNIAEPFEDNINSHSSVKICNDCKKSIWFIPSLETWV